jgi:hypothetical protein
MNFIQGEKFKVLADNKKIFYRHTHLVNYFFKNETPKDEFILISHNSDGNILRDSIRYEDASLSLAPSNLIKWYGQNVCVDDPRLQSIPIGLENSQWFPEIKKIKKLENILKTPKQKINLIYANFDISTNIEERSTAYKVCMPLNYVTKNFGKNGENYDNYLENLRHHDFVLCPAGNGEDTHRLWETLYAGSIPIVKKTINTLYYKTLPICYISEWDQLKNKNFLLEQLVLLKEKINLKMLDFDYWKDIIIK